MILYVTATCIYATMVVISNGQLVPNLTDVYSYDDQYYYDTNTKVPISEYGTEYNYNSLIILNENISNIDYNDTYSRSPYVVDDDYVTNEDDVANDNATIDETTLSLLFPKCSERTILASSRARTLSSYDVTQNATLGGFMYSKTWTVVPSTPGARVTAMISEIHQNYLFSTSCFDVSWGAALRSSSADTREWCVEGSLLPCSGDDKMYFYFGINALMAPPYHALQIQQNLAMFPDGYFKVYYYECGGRVGSGKISSPTFPLNKDIGAIECTWNLHVPVDSDYGILKFNKVKLPSCSTHQIVIKEDTLIPESEISDEILRKIKARSLRKRDLSDDENDEEYFYETTSGYKNYSYPEVVTKEQKYSNAPIYEFYKDNSNTSSKGGIHAVVINTYCGNYLPRKTMYWRRGSKNVSITYTASAEKSGRQGFVASFTVFSWKQHLEDHSQHTILRKEKKKKTILEDWPNYIGVMVFLPLGFIIGLTIIIVHVVRSGPSLRDFYKKEKQEAVRRRRAMSAPNIIPEGTGEDEEFLGRIRSFSTRRARSLRESFSSRFHPGKRNHGEYNANYSTKQESLKLPAKIILSRTASGSTII